MPSQKAALLVLALLSVTALAQNAYYWTRLPERVATHFGINGQSDSWMHKDKATVLMLVTQIGLPAILVGVAAAVSVLPTSLINIPDREYWLHADRRQETLAYVKRLVSWIAVLTTLFMMIVSHLVFVANRTGDGLQLRWFGLALALYLTVVLALVGFILQRFRKPTEAV